MNTGLMIFAQIVVVIWLLAGAMVYGLEWYMDGFPPRIGDFAKTMAVSGVVCAINAVLAIALTMFILRST